jgi:hypothetical protein
LRDEADYLASPLLRTVLNDWGTNSFSSRRSNHVDVLISKKAHIETVGKGLESSNTPNTPDVCETPAAAVGCWFRRWRGRTRLSS